MSFRSVCFEPAAGGARIRASPSAGSQPLFILSIMSLLTDNSTVPFCRLYLLGMFESSPHLPRVVCAFVHHPSCAATDVYQLRGECRVYTVGSRSPDSSIIFLKVASTAVFLAAVSRIVFPFPVIVGKRKEGRGEGHLFLI